MVLMLNENSRAYLSKIAEAHERSGVAKDVFAEMEANPEELTSIGLEL